MNHPGRTTPRRTTGTVDVVIAGAPRSGTSMLADSFVRAGHTAGENLIPPSPANPNGFFEDLAVNVANDDLLASLDTVDGTTRPPRSLWWLGAFAGPTDMATGADEAPGRDALVPRGPFVLKDPRFSHTLPSWAPLRSAVTIVMVRSPREVAASVRGMIMPARPGSLFDASSAHCGSMWSAMYRSILAWCDDRTIFVDVRSVRDGTVFPYLRDVTGANVGHDHVAAALHRHGAATDGCDVDASVLDGVRDQLARHAFNRGRPVLARDNP